MNEDYGTCTYDGTTYAMLEDARVSDHDGADFEAYVWPADRISEYDPKHPADAWKAYWTADWSKANGEDFSDCCDWEHPDAIEG